jgi:monoamine oxidase
LLASTGIKTKQLPERHWQFVDHQPCPVQFDRAWETALDRLQKTNRDQSFASFLRECCDQMTNEERALVTEYVEGFNAADSQRISTAWLRKSELEVGAASEAAIRRVTNGFDTIPAVLVSDLMPAEIRLNTLVAEVRWRPGKAEVATTEDNVFQNYSADYLIVTLPVGILPYNLFCR